MSKRDEVDTTEDGARASGRRTDDGAGEAPEVAEPPAGDADAVAAASATPQGEAPEVAEPPAGDADAVAAASATPAAAARPAGAPELAAGVPRWWPSCGEIALAYVLGSACVALANAFAIAIAVPLPRAGLALRAGHHAFDALDTLAGGAALALPAWLADRLGRGRSRSAHVAVVVTCVLCAWALLGRDLRNQASSVLDGAIEEPLTVVYVIACGLAAPAALVAGVALASRRWLFVVPLAFGAALLVTTHLWLPDDYPEVHAALSWVGAALAGAALVPRVARVVAGRRRLALEVGSGAALLVGIGWPAPNAVRLELFREPGSSASYLFARLFWTVPVVGRSAYAGWHSLVHGALEPSVVRPLVHAPVVVMITVDALRADVLDGRFDDALPSFAALRDRGAWFPRAVAPGSQTSVSLSSLFTGRYFSQLRWEPYGEGQHRFLYPAADPSIRFPALLDEAGVRTESFLGLSFLSADHGIARGFGVEHVFSEGRTHAFATQVLDPLLTTLRGVGSSPAFLYAHVMEPHAPYDRGAKKDGTDFERYVSEVAALDGYVRRIQRELSTRFRGRGYLVLSADHGEAFGEHGTHFHTKTLYEELLRVPLIVWGPHITAARHDERVGLIDVGPTLLELFGLRRQGEQMGESLLDLCLGKDGRFSRQLAAEGRMRRAVYDGELKVLEDLRRGTVELFDLATDPDELANAFDLDDPRTRAALGGLRAFFDVRAYRAPDYAMPYKP